MKTIKGFEGEDLEVSNFGEWIGNDYIDYKFEYENNRKVMKELQQENQELKKQLEEKENQQKEFIDYLENEIQSCELTCDLKEQLQQKEDIINKAKELIKEMTYGGNEDYYMENFKTVLKILDNKGE